RSHNCGKELEFFDRRRRQHFQEHSTNDEPAHRILPLFWEDSTWSLKNVSSGIQKFVKRHNLTQHGLPENYPAVGLSQICKLRGGNNYLEQAYQAICRTFAERIVELADESP